MGSRIELNDTLQITREQGFPEELDYKKHLATPLTAQDFEGRVFEFRNKKDVRVYQQMPVRNFLAENTDGKWRYWGLIHVLEITQNYETQTTSGKFRIEYIYTPEQMEQVYDLIDRRPDQKF